LRGRPSRRVTSKFGTWDNKLIAGPFWHESAEIRDYFK
jgi:hypothetical protein